ncbi:hypothetical protein AB0M95_32590 [Sphaerisporangium sp. NPDC051017]|uniref:hypothetical protein n=1 Tax=Sphaerisporangium sp. NPDC051017 TaxID=3154636 RepID=UPI003418896A
MWLLKPLHSFIFVTLVQHLMGLAMGVMVYALARRRASGLRREWAALAAAPVLLDVYQMFFEHTILSDVLFSFLVTTAVTVLLWRASPSLGGVAVAGGLLAAASITRSIGLALLPILAYYLFRSGWRLLCVALITVLLPLGGYSFWYASWHGTFGLNGGSGVWLWARTMPFADCDRIRPSGDEALLCPTQPLGRRPASPYFIWSDWSPLRRVPGYTISARADLFQPGLNKLSGDFAVHAILSQPVDYLGTVLKDLNQTLNWKRGPNPVRSLIGFNRYAFPNVADPLPDEVRIPGATIHQDLTAYEQGGVSTTFHEPAASIMRGYQGYFFAPGTFLGVLAIGACCLYVRVRMSGAGRQAVRKAVLPLGVALALIVGPIAVTSYDSRYWLPAIPMLCVALALALDAGTTSLGWRQLLLPSGSGRNTRHKVATRAEAS